MQLVRRLHPRIIRPEGVKDMSNLIKIEEMSVSFATPRGELKAVRDVSFELAVGES